MLKSQFSVAAAMATGAALAFLSLTLNVPTGWIGGLALIIWAISARKNWMRVETETGLEPSGPERVLRLRSIGTALLLGHLVAGLSQPAIDLHVGQGNSLAIDSWTMFGAVIIAGVLFRHDENLRDERDEAITAKGTKIGYYSLIGLLVILLTLLGFLPEKILAELSYFSLANSLVAIILLSITIKYSVQLMGYAKDTEATLAMGLEQ